MKQAGPRVAFCGPSVHGLPRRVLDGIDLRAPARRGDFLAAVKEGARAILLVDGAFGDAPTVSHKEILHALDAGVRVGGAASLGAIRAAECATYGMIGIGSIYAEYASGHRSSDADVMLCHAPAELGHAPTTLSLIDCEASLRALPTGVLSLAEVTAVLVQARALNSSERTWKALAATLPAGRQAQVVRMMERYRVHRKRDDAKLGVNWLKEKQLWEGKHLVSGGVADVSPISDFS